MKVIIANQRVVAATEIKLYLSKKNSNKTIVRTEINKQCWIDTLCTNSLYPNQMRKLDDSYLLYLYYINLFSTGLQMRRVRQI
jgi:hypothetical protein